MVEVTPALPLSSREPNFARMHERSASRGQQGLIEFQSELTSERPGA
jgi:hypothetical protein